MNFNESVKQLLKHSIHQLNRVEAATFHKHICFLQVVRCRERSYTLEGCNLTVGRLFFQVIDFSKCSSFSGIQDFVIELSLFRISDGSEVQVSEVLDLSTAVYGKVEITDTAGISLGLDVHLRSVVADSDNTPGGGNEFDLITDG